MLEFIVKYWPYMLGGFLGGILFEIFRSALSRRELNKRIDKLLETVRKETMNG